MVMFFFIIMVFLYFTCRSFREWYDKYESRRRKMTEEEALLLLLFLDKW